MRRTNGWLSGSCTLGVLYLRKSLRRTISSTSNLRRSYRNPSPYPLRSFYRNAKSCLVSLSLRYYRQSMKVLIRVSIPIRRSVAVLRTKLAGTKQGQILTWITSRHPRKRGEISIRRWEDLRELNSHLKWWPSKRRMLNPMLYYHLRSHLEEWSLRNSNNSSSNSKYRSLLRIETLSSISLRKIRNSSLSFLP
jgi:hypothetical protein